MEEIICRVSVNKLNCKRRKMRTTIGPQDGNGCGSDENKSRLERQLEWSRRIDINELKRIYGASLFLRCMGALFFVLAMLAFCAAASIVFDRILPEFRLYPEWTLLLPVVLIAAQHLKKLKLPSLYSKTITVFQIGLVIAIGYFFFDFVIRVLIARSLVWGWTHDGLLFLISSFLFILMKMVFDILWNDRSRQIRFGLIVTSLSCGIIGGIFLPSAYAVIGGVLMAGILWITAFSKVRHQLFRSDALSHKQLYAVLEQKKREIPDNDLVIEEERCDIFYGKFCRISIWFFLTVLIIAAFWISFTLNHKWFLRIAAEFGCAGAQHDLGVYDCRDRNYFEAEKWLHKAAEKGLCRAQYRLGCFYYYGEGRNGKPDYLDAAKWFHAADKQGCSTPFKLGTCYAARQDHAEAVKWYRRYVDHENAELKKEYRPIPALNLAETYIILGEYDRAISFLDDPRLRQEQNVYIRCLRLYLKACVLLAKGENAEAEIGEFDQVFPRYKSSYSGRDVTALRIWLENAGLSDSARQTIAELTNRVDYRR